jgi:hypothetical protein
VTALPRRTTAVPSWNVLANGAAELLETFGASVEREADHVRSFLLFREAALEVVPRVGRPSAWK